MLKMFKFKSRKQLKGEIASLEKQLEIRGEQVKELEKEGLELKDYKYTIEYKYLDMKDKLIEEEKQNKELRATIEDRNNVVEYWKKDCLKYRELFNDKEEALKELKDLEQRAKRKVINLESTLERRDGVIKILEKDVEVLEEKLGKYMEQEAEKKRLRNELRRVDECLYESNNEYCKLKDENKKLKEKNKKLNDAILTVKGIEPDRVWANIAYVKE